jgi:hypothetical protein
MTNAISRRRALLCAACLGIVAVSVLVAAPGRASAQPLTRVSVGAGGAQSNGASGAAVMTADGTKVAFVSAASNLVPNDTNNSLDVFVRDVQSGVTTRVSVAPDGSQRQGDSGGPSPGDPGFGGRSASAFNLDMDDHARFVAFASSAPLAADDTNQCVPPGSAVPVNCPDIYVRDLLTQFTLRISVGPGGVQANGASRHPRVLSNGLGIVFVSDASNLVPDDANGVADVFHWDLVTGQVRLVSRSDAGVPGNRGSERPAFGDGAIVWISGASNFSTEPDPVPCYGGAPCERAYTYDPSRRQTVRVPLPTIDAGTPANPARVVVTSVESSDVIEVDAAGQLSSVWSVVGVQAARIPLTGGPTTYVTWLYNVQGQRIIYVRAGGVDEGLHMDGRHLAIGGASGQAWTVTNTSFGLDESYTFALSDSRPFLGEGGTRVVFSSPSALVAGDTNGAPDVYVLDRDPDRDQIPSDWESMFGLDPSSGADAGLDPDGDGLSTFIEYRQGRHPRGASVKYLAEGASNAFFKTRIALVNPGATAATAVLRYFGTNRELSRAQVVAVGARQRATVLLDDVGAAPDYSFSTAIESDQPLVVDRTMWWDASAYGSHAERAMDAPSTTWFVAEGATHGGFALFYLLQNPSLEPAHVTMTYLRPAPAAPIVRTHTVGGEQRLTIVVDAEAPELAATDVSARLDSDRPILVEHAMYLDVPHPFQLGGAGIAGTAVTSTAPRWFLAEGATGSFFDLYYLLANPSTQDTRVRITYLLPSGAPLVKEYDLPRQSRRTLGVDFEDARLANTSVSAIVESLDSTGIVVERSMWWPGQGNWQEGHLAAGVTAPGARWALADGETGGANAAQTYVLIANTSATAGTATLTLLFEQGAAEEHTVALPPNSRVTVPMAQYASTSERRFGVVVDGGGLPIVVERAMYSNANGITWASGTASVATPVP